MFGAHRLDEGSPSHHEFHFIGLKVSDKVEGSALIGVIGQMCGHFLHPVLAADGDTGGNGLPDGVGRLHLGGGYQRDLRRIAAHFSGRLCNVVPYRLNLLRKRHTASPYLLSFISYLLSHSMTMPS